MTPIPCELTSAPKLTRQREAERLQALHDLGILDTPPESTFDEVVHLAASICGTSMAYVNLIDTNRQWFKARIGLAATEVSREGSICDYTIGRTTPLVIADTVADPEFTANKFVTGDPNLRFYAGMPLNTSDGHTVGTLCVADTVPHQLTVEQTESLCALGRQVAAQIELRAKLELLANVVEQKERMERKLRERTLLFTSFMDHSPTLGFIKDPEGRFVYYNRCFCERFAVSPKEWIGKNVFDIFPPEFAGRYHELDMAVLASGVAQMVEEESPGPNNTTIHWRSHKFRIDDGSERGLLGGLSLDITEQREASMLLESSHAKLEIANQMLMELSQTDGLTGLRNRRAFDDRFTKCLSEELPFSLILLDIDHFKRLNDNFGHAAGDAVLRMVANLLREQCRPSDEVARIGGEEFAILLPRTLAEQALSIANRLRATIAEFPWRDQPLTLSAGVVTRSAALGSVAELMGAADAALYRAKRDGRNRVEAAEPVIERDVNLLEFRAVA